MSVYRVLARRYRPQTFEDLVGQETVVRTLRNALASGKVPHAYVFSGLRGVGKTTAARILAKALNCEKGVTPDPCGVCVPCREIAEGTSMDVLEIDAASNRGIDNVRELREVARILPVRDRYRVFILDEAHQLTGEAFNALLKILEEPPPHVVFILASTEKHKFPPTILSRCQQLDFRPLPAETIAARLQEVAKREGFTVEDAAAHLIARAAQGSLRDGLSMLDQVRSFAGGAPVDAGTVSQVLGLPPLELLWELWQGLASGNPGKAVDLVARLEAQGGDSLLLYQELLELLRSLVLVAANPEVPLPYPPAFRKALHESSSQLGFAVLLRILTLAIQGRELVAAAPSPGLGVMAAVGKLALWPRVKRVEELLVGGEASPQKPSSKPPREAELPLEPSPMDDFVDQVSHQLGVTLAARLKNSCQLSLEGDELVIHLRAGKANAAARAVEASLDRLEALARERGLARKVRLAVAEPEPSLAQQVVADPRVQAVLEVFGGTIAEVEEQK